MNAEAMGKGTFVDDLPFSSRTCPHTTRKLNGVVPCQTFLWPQKYTEPKNGHKEYRHGEKAKKGLGEETIPQYGPEINRDSWIINEALHQQFVIDIAFVGGYFIT